MPFAPLLFFAAPLAASTPQPSAEVRQLVQDCDAHKFERIVTATVNGEVKTSRMRLCGVQGQSDSDWLHTLQDSAKKVQANERIPAPMKTAMLAAIDEEVTQLQLNRSLDTIAPATSGGGGKSAGFEPLASTPAVRRDSAPSIAPSSAFTLKPRSLNGPSLALRRDYGALPPMPDPLPEGRKAAAAKAAPPVPIPDLRFRCFSTDSISEDDCVDLNRYSTLVIEARGTVAPGTVLHFSVNGKDKAEAELSGMPKGQVRRIELPAGVCRGISSGSLKLVTMVQPADTNFPPQRATSDGPFPLHCA